ncbi:hypothetical protein GALMADRAFT_721596 [Galerina marginata CBS 339.88]|uniref:Uncharacterized protein n=1 Tax=Galerina marginata (strain CBS 339.88) TaxID=685588 RepID=A0A067SQF7_GALM3|nr:hypothetical protein GALMADRAFT_721596 [Galerina marginata CBS 339.88]
MFPLVPCSPSRLAPGVHVSDRASYNLSIHPSIHPRISRSNSDMLATRDEMSTA